MDSFDVDPNADTDSMSVEEFEHHESQMKLLRKFLDVCGGRDPDEVMREFDHRIDVQWGIARCGPGLCSCSHAQGG